MCKLVPVQFQEYLLLSEAGFTQPASRVYVSSLILFFLAENVHTGHKIQCKKKALKNSLSLTFSNSGFVSMQSLRQRSKKSLWFSKTPSMLVTFQKRTKHLNIHSATKPSQQVFDRHQAFQDTINSLYCGHL